MYAYIVEDGDSLHSETHITIREGVISDRLYK